MADSVYMGNVGALVAYFTSVIGLTVRSRRISIACSGDRADFFMA